jgi:hypothetical protein
MVIMNDNFSYSLFSTARQGATEPFRSYLLHFNTSPSLSQLSNLWRMSSTLAKLAYAQKALHSTNAQLDLLLVAVLLTHATQAYVETLKVATPAHQPKVRIYPQQCPRKRLPL